MIFIHLESSGETNRIVLATSSKRQARSFVFIEVRPSGTSPALLWDAWNSNWCSNLRSRCLFGWYEVKFKQSYAYAKSYVSAVKEYLGACWRSPRRDDENITTFWLCKRFKKIEMEIDVALGCSTEQTRQQSLIDGDSLSLFSHYTYVLYIIPIVGCYSKKKWTCWDYGYEDGLLPPNLW